jgi:class 3 adenylate cyclase
MIPINLEIKAAAAVGPVEAELRRLLAADPLADGQELRRRLLESGLLQARDLPLFNDVFIRARTRVVYERVNQELQGGARTIEDLHKAILPAESTSTSTPIRRLIDTEYKKAMAMRALEPLGQPSRDDGLRLLTGKAPTPPILPLAKIASSTGFVDYLPQEDGVVRVVPLWVELAGRRYPQVGLAMALQMLGVHPADVRIERERIVIPQPDGSQRIVPVRRQRLEDNASPYDGFIDLPWFGRRNNWEGMYDYPDRRYPSAHRPILHVWNLVQFRQRIRANNQAADLAVGELFKIVDGADGPILREFGKRTYSPDDPAALKAWIERALGHSDIQEVFKQAEETERSGAALDDDTLGILRAVRDLKRVMPQNLALQSDWERRRREVAEEFAGKAVLIGWTATGAAADFVPTPLHAKCPGPIVHGVVFNNIMNGDLWRAAPAAATTLCVLLVGLLTTLGASGPSPLTSTVSAAVIAAGYITVNGYLLFDYGDLILGLASPLTAATSAWLCCVVLRWVIERAERARITRRFRSYVDPELVNYVIEHPESTKLDGQIKEMTVVFTDLAGFTTISEKLGPATVGLLNEYFGIMVPAIRSGGGYLNKFLGDGIMFFFGSPRENPRHAADAVATVMKMQELIPPFNQQLKARGLPGVKMRVGISSGLMVVGDAGPSDASDYTVLGDAVNLAARLESANKATGTLIMMNDRCAELIGDRCLLRPLAKLQVVGKTQGVATFEPLCWADRADESQRRLAAMTREMFDHYQAARFTECERAAQAIDAVFGASKLTALYVEECRRLIAEPDPQFAGVISLTEK